MKSYSSLGPLEQQIMEVIWHQHPITVRQVVTVFQQKRTIAYTTVLTIMSRLVKKGYLTQIKEGKINIFSPKKNQEQTLHSLVKQTLQLFTDRFGEDAVAAFLDEADQLSKTSSKRKK